MIYMVNGAKFFSKLDITKAFHQLELAEESRHLTTIVTHKGLYRYKRLHMGISCASEEFTEAIRVMLQGIEGQLNMTDDILVFGATQEEHDQALERVLAAQDDGGVTLNMDKCELRRQELTFVGLSQHGIAPTEDRCKALREAPPPTCVKDFRSLLGLAQWNARFIEDLAGITEPLWRLTKDGTKWQWNEEQQRAFTALKDAISTSCLAFFDKDWLTELHVDASPVGLAAILVQFDPADARSKRIVSFVASISRRELITATAEDTTLTQWLRGGGRAPLPQELHMFKNVKDELCCAEDGVLLRGRQIVVPTSLRARVVALAHQGHQGVAQCKALIRSKVWFPGIDDAVEMKVKSCEFCQASLPSHTSH